MSPVRETAWAKINLFLHVSPPRDDGYHDLVSLVGFADFGDALVLAPSAHWALDVDGPFAGGLETGPDNLVTRAGVGLAAALGRAAEAHVRLTKRLPVASGVGGGSADAAATIRGLEALWGGALEDEARRGLALTLGADVPVCLASENAMMRGVGEVLSPAPAIDAGLLLVNPGVATPTGAIFKAYDAASRFDALEPACNLSARATLDARDLAALMGETRNDLEAPAIAARPQIAEVLTALRALDGVRAARMSGSGATVFAVFDDAGAAGAAAGAIEAAQPDWWVAAGAFKR